MTGAEDECAVKYGAILEELRDASFAAEGPSVRRLARMWSELTGLSIDWDTAALMLIQQALVEDLPQGFGAYLRTAHLIEIANLAILLAADREVRNEATLDALLAAKNEAAAALNEARRERRAETRATEPEADPAETVAFAQMAAAFERKEEAGGGVLLPLEDRQIVNGADGHLYVSVTQTAGYRDFVEMPADTAETPAEPEPILIEDDDTPAEVGGVPPEPEPVAEAVAEPEVAQAEPGAEVAPEPEAAQVEAEVEPEPEPLESRMAGTMADVLTEAMARRASEPAPVEPEEEEEGQPPAADVWTARDDLQLATLMFGGQGVKHASLKMGRSKDDCIKRYRELMPRPGSAAQQALVKRLRAQVEAEGPDVA